ncbi:MAG: GSCFA domain-containing protein [Prevotella sp.]|nr:GSCFA domain-containing protein [Prevotella sp.]
MEFRTIVDIPKPDFEIAPCEEMLFVGSCFATEIGRRFQEEKFRAVVNPYGVMYNPASILHTVERWTTSPCVVFLTLGTNHIYRLKETGEIVDNCQKRPQSLFTEEELSVDACADYLQKTIDILRQRNPEVNIVLTVSPIRYRKYGYHESQLSKATLLLAVEKVTGATYFPAYEILNDELRDYRFYKEDMLHPSDQAVEYIWERLSDVYLSAEAKAFLKEWAPLKAVLNHKPFDPDSEEYRTLMDKTMLKVAALQKKYPNFAV